MPRMRRSALLLIAVAITTMVCVSALAQQKDTLMFSIRGDAQQHETWKRVLDSLNATQDELQAEIE